MIRLTDEQWERIRDHFPEENIADGRPGRKPTPTRCVLEAVLWILNTGAQWHMLPQSYEARKRHENHGDCRSPWIAALGQHARSEPSRSAFGAAMFRLLHDRSQAGKLDRRSRL